MNAPDKLPKSGLALLREPFPAHLINKLPKGTKAQNECPASDKVNCKVCGGWHHPKIIHLDYVGHAALTDRLLDADPSWSWEPVAYRDGLPAFDESGGLWIKLTVCGVTRLGYGHAAASSYKDIGAREKEVIGDALRNAAMRFGAALDLWHKGDLHAEDTAEEPKVHAPGPGHAPAKAAMNGVEIPPEIMAQLRTLAMDLVHYCEACSDPVTAYNALQECRLGAGEYEVTGDYLLALNEILAPNSKTRAALKAEGKARREAAKSKDIAGAM